MFERTANLSSNQIINYRCDPSEKWLVLIGIAPGAPEVSNGNFNFSVLTGIANVSTGGDTSEHDKSFLWRVYVCEFDPSIEISIEGIYLLPSKGPMPPELLF